MPRVSHPWRKHFCDAGFIVMEVDTSVIIILVMSWNTSTTAQVWLSWFCHKIVMDVHAWQKTWPTMTNTYHHGSVFFCSVKSAWIMLAIAAFYDHDDLWSPKHTLQKITLSWWYMFVTVGHVFCHACTSMTILWKNQDSHTCVIVEVFHDITKIIITEVFTSMTINHAS